MFSIIKGTLFLGTNYDQGTFSDYHWPDPYEELLTGCKWINTASNGRQGLFCGTFRAGKAGDDQIAQTGSRLSKN